MGSSVSVGVDQAKDTIDVYYTTPNLSSTTYIPRCQADISVKYRSTMVVKFFDGTSKTAKHKSNVSCKLSYKKAVKSVTIQYHPLQLFELDLYYSDTIPYMTNPTLGDYYKYAKERGIDVDTRSQRLDIPLWEFQVMDIWFPLVTHKVEILPDRIKRGEKELLWHNIVHADSSSNTLIMYTHDGSVEWKFACSCEEVAKIVETIKALIRDEKIKALRLADLYEILVKKIPNDTAIEILKMI